MSAHTKVPGIYMIKNKLDGKVYIGQSSDILRRFKQYRWAVNSSCKYADVERNVTKAMRKYGIEHFEFIILIAGDEYSDLEARCVAEQEYIALYHANDPDYGYNETCGGDTGLTKARKQHLVERNKRSIDMFLYDTKTDYTLLFFSGSKGIGDYLGYGKDVISHTMNRGSLLDNRYYIIPVDYERRHDILSKLNNGVGSQIYSTNRGAKRE